MATVSDDSTHAGLQVDPALRDFVADELLAGLDLEPERFWSIVADLQERFAGRVEQLLRRRDELQEQIDAWHREHGAGDVAALEAFLTEIGYLLPLEEPTVRVTRVDREIAEVPGPQLVVPGDRAAVRAERRQRPLGLAVRRALRHRRAAPRPRAGARLRRAPRRAGHRRGRPAARPASSRWPRAATPTSPPTGCPRRASWSSRPRRARPAWPTRRSSPGHRAGRAATARPRCCCAATGCTSS